MIEVGPERRSLSAQTLMRLQRTTDDENARSALDCGSCSYRTPRCLRHSHFHNSKRRSRRTKLAELCVIWTSFDVALPCCSPPMDNEGTASRPPTRAAPGHHGPPQIAALMAHLHSSTMSAGFAARERKTGRPTMNRRQLLVKGARWGGAAMAVLAGHQL